MGAPHLIHPVILAGGSGVRLWPLSRQDRPKPFLALSGDRTFLQMTAARTSAPERFANPLVICSTAHRFLVAEQLLQSARRPRQIVLEPVARNTAPAACTAALLLAAEEPHALMMLLPSDHFIQDEQAFALAIGQAAEAAAQGWIVTFGARPDRPETGYGYIQKGERLDGCDGSFHIARFVEKPDLPTAKRYLAGGDFAWNSGMFVASAGRLLDEMRHHAPEILAACEKALKNAVADADFLRLDEAAFAGQPSLSFDRAVMEHTSRGAMVPIDIGWSDVGSWDALYQIAGKDANGNVLKGDVAAADSRNTYLHSESVPIAALGLDGIAVISMDDVILVCPRNRSQDISLLIDRLKAEPRFASLATTHAAVPKR
jgi:mannose-1-phosphate guanylyltransferase/mannose-1-phosphate guanylyltransferase/mannose-6-phosphate isomerase